MRSIYKKNSYKEIAEIGNFYVLVKELKIYNGGGNILINRH